MAHPQMHTQIVLEMIVVVIHSGIISCPNCGGTGLICPICQGPTTRSAGEHRTTCNHGISVYNWHCQSGCDWCYRQRFRVPVLQNLRRRNDGNMPKTLQIFRSSLKLSKLQTGLVRQELFASMGTWHRLSIVRMVALLSITIRSKIFLTFEVIRYKKMLLKSKERLGRSNIQKEILMIQ